MKQVTGRLSELARALTPGTGGVTQSTADSIIELPPRAQMVLELPAVFKSAAQRATAVEVTDTFGFEVGNTNVGVVGAFFAVSPSFARGLWRIKGNLVHQYQAAAPANPNRGSSVVLVDPVGAATMLAVAFFMNGSLTVPFDVVCSFDTIVPAIGWALRFATDATVAGDTLSSRCMAVCSRLL